MVAVIKEPRHSAKKQWDAAEAARKSNIAPLPAIVNPERRDACALSLRLFLETYFAKAFYRKWSADHLDVIEKTQRAILDGYSSAVAMPRGSGKTTIHQRAAIWAIVYGHRRFVWIVAADATKAKGCLRSIKTTFESNQLLYEDFPEVCAPIRRLRRNALAAKSQHIDGAPTLIDWTAECAQMPQVEGSLASGARIGVGGITGAAGRGAQITLPDDSVLRPSLILVDDFQSRESAASQTQCRTRLDTISGDLMGMRGPGEKFAMLVTCTVIYQGDAADQLLDRKRFPEFHGTRKKLIYKWPDNEKLWEEYAELRNLALREDREPVEANGFVADNYDALHAGSEVAWPERKEDGDHSALQHAYNLKIADPENFAAEYQNEPVSRVDNDISFATADEIAEKLSGREKGKLPGSTERVAASIDVQGNSLWWGAAGLESGFGGSVLDYGVFPPQGRMFFTQRDLPVTFQTLWPGLTEEQAIAKALGLLVEKIAAMRWTLDNGAEVGVSKILIDEGYKDLVVHEFCKSSPHRSLLMPAKGMGVEAGDVPMNDRPKKAGEIVGHNWRERLAPNNRTLRHVIWDTNWWKAFIHERWKTPPGGRGCLNISGTKAFENRLFGQHQVAEYPIKTEGRGRVVIECKLRPNRPDNHWLDMLGMCFVGGSMSGIRILEDEAAELTFERKRMSDRMRARAS